MSPVEGEEGSARVEGSSDGREPRRPYVRPAISWEESIDVRANLSLACAKFGGQGFACDSSPQS